MTTITINTAPTTISAAYDALQAEIGESHQRWIAVVDDYSYISGGKARVVGVVGAPQKSAGSVYRNDGGYKYMRRLSATGTIEGNIPVGTVFKVYYISEA